MIEGITGPVRAVTFDLDYTLWDLSGVIELAERRTDDWLKHHYPEVGHRYDAAARRELRLAIAERAPELAHDVSALRREGLRAAGADCGYAGADLETLVDGAFEAFIEGRHEVRLYSDTLPFLDWIGRHVPLGAITNGNADVERLSLGAYFDFTVSAMEIGASKPSHLVFEAAASRAGVPAASVVHVGDDCECDVVGAAAFGMQSVWIARHGETWPPELEAAYRAHVTNLDALADVLAPPIGVTSGVGCDG